MIGRLGPPSFLKHTLQRNLDLCIPRKGIARPQSQFPHSCVCERSHVRSTYFPAAELADRSWEFKFAHRNMNV
jgi:hypothetical protein